MKNRIQRMYEETERLGIDLLWIENPVDLFYLTGISFSAGQLLVFAKSATLIVDGRYYETAKRQISDCKVILSSKGIWEDILKDVRNIGFDSAYATVDRLEALRRLAPNRQWIAIPNLMKHLRVCKDAKELSALKKAAELTWAGYLHLVQEMQEGVEEKELAWKFERFCKERGADQLSFDPIIAFGENSAYPHYRAGNAKLKNNQIVLFDLGASVDRYRGDMTRVVFFGDANPQLENWYHLIQSAYDAAFALVRPGCRLGDLDLAARSILAKHNVEHLFCHGLGHGIGLETHEYPSVRNDGADKDLILQPGMVFTIEPGLYSPGLGGVRYENVVVVTESGAGLLYAGV